jgi:hypothetical protein
MALAVPLPKPLNGSRQKKMSTNNLNKLTQAMSEALDSEAVTYQRRYPVHHWARNNATSGRIGIFMVLEPVGSVSL